MAPRRSSLTISSLAWFMRDLPQRHVRSETTRRSTRHAMAKAAIEMALLDAELTASGMSLAKFWVRPMSRYLLARMCRLYSGLGVCRGRTSSQCRVHAGQDQNRTWSRRGMPPSGAGAFPDISLSADANGAYDLRANSHREALLAMDRLGLACLNSPSWRATSLALRACVRFSTLP